jgi:tetratricopeptide (TPR) repeat protein
VDEGDWRRARDAAEALYSLDPADPRAAERVIEARGRSGLLGEARAAFEEYLGTIPSGSKPAGEVSETMDRVHATARIKARTRQPTRPELPFVGRRRALSTARSSLEQVAANGFRLVLISGESGIGKTRLLDQVHGEAIMRGFRCLRAQPVELEQSIPLNPILDCLTGIDLRSHLQAIGSPWSSVIAGLLPPGTFEDPLENPPPIRPSSLSRRLLDSFALLFERLAREQPTVLLLDDLQWADATTVATLQFLQRRWTGGSMGIFATLRPELVRVTDPLAKYLTGAGGLPAKRIELTSLATSEAIELVDAIADGEISERHANRLCAIAGHHPLYLTELAREFLAGRLVLPDLPGDQVTIPPSLGHMLDARLESMDSDAMTAAGLLAVAARPLKVPVIAELTGIGLQHVAAAVEALERGRFVVVEGESVRIAHELFRSAVYRHLSGPRRALHHRAIAARLLSESPNESSGELAVHFARAGQDDLAASHGWSAARRAMDAGAIAEAVELFEIVSERDREPARRAEATAELARALVLSRDISRANPCLGRAAEQLRSTGKADVARRLEIERIGGLAELAEASLGELLVGLGAIKAEAREAHDWETVAQALDVELHLLHRSGAVEAIRGVLEEMRDVALKDQREARLLSKAGLALGVFFDDPEEALRAAEEAVDLAGDERRYRLHALVRLIIVLHAGGRLSRPEAVAVTSEASALAARCGDVLQQYAIESNVAAALLDAGDLEQAEAKMVGAATGQYSGEMALQRFIRKNNHAELAVARGDFATAQHAYLDAATHLGPTTPTYMRDLLNAGLGYCAIETGDLGEARRREDMLHEPPSSWYFDPTTLLAFRTRMLERRQRWQEAATVLELAASDLQHRLVLAWFKLRLLQARILAKHGDRSATDVADQALQRARELQLSHREREFAAVLDSLR